MPTSSPGCPRLPAAGARRRRRRKTTTPGARSVSPAAPEPPLAQPMVVPPELSGRPELPELPELPDAPELPELPDPLELPDAPELPEPLEDPLEDPPDASLAVTVLASLIDTVQLPVPLHAPLHPRNDDPPSAVAVKVTLVPAENSTLQPAAAGPRAHVFPDGEMLALPVPSPRLPTVSV